jgi:hypothetical protein
MANPVPHDKCCISLRLDEIIETQSGLSGEQLSDLMILSPETAENKRR